MARLVHGDAVEALPLKQFWPVQLSQVQDLPQHSMVREVFMGCISCRATAWHAVMCTCLVNCCFQKLHKHCDQLISEGR